MGGCRFDSVSDLPEKYREKINAEIKRQNVNRAARAAVELVQSAREVKEKPAKKKERKFHNRPTERIMPNGDVRTFDSAREASRYDELMLMFASGIEKIIAVYPVAMLDEDTYRRIHASAAQNAKALKGKKKHILLEKPQRKAPIDQVTVALIVADQVEEAFRSKLKDVASKQVGDGETVSMIPCVVDLEKQRCIFDSTREVFLDGHYPVKNRGIRLIKRYLFRGGLRLIGDSNDFLKNEAAAAENGEEKEVLEMNFWEFARMTKKEMAGCDEEDEKRFKQMKHREIVVEGEYLYLKWEQSGIWTALEMDEKARTVKIDPIVSWYYPRARKIDKETVKKLKKEIGAYFAGEGCTVKYNAVR